MQWKKDGHDFDLRDRSTLHGFLFEHIFPPNPIVLWAKVFLFWHPPSLRGRKSQEDMPLSGELLDRLKVTLPSHNDLLRCLIDEDDNGKVTHFLLNVKNCKLLILWCENCWLSQLS